MCQIVIFEQLHNHPNIIVMPDESGATTAVYLDTANTHIWGELWEKTHPLYKREGPCSLSTTANLQSFWMKNKGDL